MNRLQSELERLYLTRATVGGASDAPAPDLVDAQGAVRAMVIELARPASWEVLAQVWTGAQRDLDLPAPAIAVSGTDGLQLWFSLGVAVPARRAHAFLAALRDRFLPGIDATRVRLMPSAHAAPRHAPRVPALQGDGENWSAFVAPDLAAVFAESPWLDIEPGDEGQAALLRDLRSIDAAAFDAAARRLGIAAARPVKPASTSVDALPAAARPIRNLDELEFASQSHGATFQASGANVSRDVGAVKLGYGVTRVPAGKRAWPLHNHHANEEMFFVLSGTGTWRSGDESWPIRAGDFIAAPAGDRATAHQIVNDSAEALCYLAVSTEIRPDIVEYPDSNKFSASAGPAFSHVGTTSDAVDYWLGED